MQHGSPMIRHASVPVLEFCRIETDMSMREHEDVHTYRKKATYGSLWHELTVNAEAADIDFIVNGILRSAEVSLLASGHRIAAHILKEGDIAWFIDDENKAKRPPHAERIDEWIVANVEDLNHLLSFVKTFTSDDIDYAKYRSDGQDVVDPAVEITVETVAAKTLKKSKKTVKQSATRAS